MTREEIILAEWKALRNEIGKRQEFNERLVLGLLAATLAILSFAFKDSKIEGVLIATLPAIMTAVAELWIYTNIHGGFRTAAYIKTKIEPSLDGLGWETWLESFNKRNKLTLNRYKILIRMLYGFSLFAFLIKSWLLYQTVPEVHLIVATTACLAIWILVVFASKFTVKKIRRQIGSIHRVISGDD